MAIQRLEEEIKLGELPGTRTILLPNDYVAEVHTGKSYIAHQEKFIYVATGIKAETFHMSEPEAGEIMEKHIGVAGSVKDIEIPSIAFYKKAKENRYAGYSTHRLFLIDTELGIIPFAYITRTFTEDHQRQHLGRSAVQLATLIHNRAAWLGFRTQSPPAVVANLESGVFKEGRLYPWQAKYNSDPNFLAHQIMMKFWYRIHRFGATPDIENGVSIHDHNEENKAYIPDPNHKATMDIKAIMEDDFHMNFKNGDMVYSVGELK